MRRAERSEPLIPTIRDQIEREIEWISRRLEENRERFVEDILFDFDLSDAAVLEMEDDDVADEDADKTS